MKQAEQANQLLLPLPGAPFERRFIKRNGQLFREFVVLRPRQDLPSQSNVPTEGFRTADLRETLSTYSNLYFALGKLGDSNPGSILPKLISISESVNRRAATGPEATRVLR